MKVFQLAGSLRTETGKKAAKAIRNNNSIPCIIYGGETVSQFTVEKEAVRKLIYSPEIFLVELTIDGKTCKAIMKDLQFHPVTDAVLHIDFLEVFEEKPIVIDVPVVLDGLAEGVKAGGKLSLEMR
ncbi:MAG: 50S ribosomal protein L25, partial [Tannerellaceae bacterium]